MIRTTYLRKLQVVLLEHTPDPQPLVYEGNPFIFVFWGTWCLFQGFVGLISLEPISRTRTTH